MDDYEMFYVHAPQTPLQARVVATIRKIDKVLNGLDYTIAMNAATHALMRCAAALVETQPEMLATVTAALRDAIEDLQTPHKRARLLGRRLQ